MAKTMAEILAAQLLVRVLRSAPRRPIILK